MADNNQMSNIKALAMINDLLQTGRFTIEANRILSDGSKSYNVIFKKADLLKDLTPHEADSQTAKLNQAFEKVKDDLAKAISRNMKLELNGYDDVDSEEQKQQHRQIDLEE